MQSFDIKCDATIIATRNDEEILENVYFRHLEIAEQLKHEVALFIQDTLQKAEPRGCSKMQRLVTRYVEQKTREKYFSSRDRLNQKTNPVVPAFKDKGAGNRRNRRLQSMVSKGQRSSGEACIFKPDPAQEKRTEIHKEPLLHQLAKRRPSIQIANERNAKQTTLFQGKDLRIRASLWVRPPQEKHMQRREHMSLSPSRKERQRPTEQTKGGICPTGSNERTPDALMQVVRGKISDWAEQLAEEARVKAWKHHKEFHITLMAYQEAQLKFFRPRRHCNP